LRRLEIETPGCEHDARRHQGRRAGHYVVLGFGDVPCLRTFRTVNDLEFDRLTLFQGPEAVATDRGIMDEYVAAALPFNETVALGVVEPLDLTCDAHRSLPYLPKTPDELPGTKKDRECLRGLDFYVAGTPPNAGAILSIRHICVKSPRLEASVFQYDGPGTPLKTCAPLYPESEFGDDLARIATTDARVR
jgi:hypothetical protein